MTVGIRSCARDAEWWWAPVPESAVAQLVGEPPGRRRNPLLLLIGLVTLPVLVLDQVTKLVVSSRMASGPSILASGAPTQK